jgi:hypothetical protein
MRELHTQLCAVRTGWLVAVAAHLLLPTWQTSTHARGISTPHQPETAVRQGAKLRLGGSFALWLLRCVVSLKASLHVDGHPSSPFCHLQYAPGDGDDFASAGLAAAAAGRLRIYIHAGDRRAWAGAKIKRHQVGPNGIRRACAQTCFVPQGVIKL